MSIIKLVMFVVSTALIGVASYNANFETSYICNSSPTGTSVGNYENVASSIVCGVMCAKNVNCESFVFISANSTCFLWDSSLTDEQACDSNVLYGKKLSVETKSCTEPVGNVRLCNGSRNGTADSTMGRLELFVDNKWGSVCDDLWKSYYYPSSTGFILYSDSQNAEVVCKLLGFKRGYAILDAAFGESRGPIHFSQMSCDGSEMSVMDCNRESNATYCGHENDVGVWCEVKL